MLKNIISIFIVGFSLNTFASSTISGYLSDATQDITFDQQSSQAILKLLDEDPQTLLRTMDLGEVKQLGQTYCLVKSSSLKVPTCVMTVHLTKFPATK